MAFMDSPIGYFGGLFQKRLHVIGHAAGAGEGGRLRLCRRRRGQPRQPRQPFLEIVVKAVLSLTRLQVEEAED